MTDKPQPEALRLANNIHCGDSACKCSLNLAAAELLRQHARIAELEAALFAYASEFEPNGDGGVQALSAAPVEVADAMADSQYLAGVSAGWNAANADDPNEALRKLHESRAGYLKPIRAAARALADSAAPAMGMTIAGDGASALGRLMREQRKSRLGLYPDGNPNAMLAASPTPTPPAEQQAAPKAAPGDAIDEAMRERDDAEDFIDSLLDEVLGHERPEWSNLYGRADALNDVQERMTALHKPAVDKAWGRLQSAMAAPQQEAQEPVAWQGVHDQTDLYYTKPLQADVRPLYAAPQPAPDCHHRPPCDECAAYDAQGGK